MVSKNEVVRRIEQIDFLLTSLQDLRRSEMNELDKIEAEAAKKAFSNPVRDSNPTIIPTFPGGCKIVGFILSITRSHRC